MPFLVYHEACQCRIIMLVRRDIRVFQCLHIFARVPPRMLRVSSARAQRGSVIFKKVKVHPTMHSKATCMEE